MRRQHPTAPSAPDPPDAEGLPATVLPIPEHDHLRILLENVPALVFTVDLDGRIVFVNRAHQGFTSEQILGRNLFEYPAPPEQRQAAREAFARAVRTGERVDYETVLDWPAGERQWFVCRLGPIRRDGHVVAVTLIVTDITARKAVEHTLQESEALFRRIAEQSPDIIFRLGVNGLEYISPAFAAVLGRNPADRLVSRVMSPQHVHPDELARIPDIIAELDHGPARCELRMLHADGHTVWTEHHLVPILSPSGRRIAVEGIIRDITMRKQAEDVLRAAHHDLEERVAVRTAELAHANQSLRTEIAERMRAQDQLRQHQAALAHVLRVSTMGEMAAGLASRSAARSSTTTVGGCGWSPTSTTAPPSPSACRSRAAERPRTTDARRLTASQRDGAPARDSIHRSLSDSSTGAPSLEWWLASRRPRL